jgi:hypothetical protein
VIRRISTITGLACAPVVVRAQAPYVARGFTQFLTPIAVADLPSRAGAVQRFNAFLAVKITGGVGTMWCAYLFALLAFIGLPAAIKGGTPTVISWIAQTFLQLVLLSIIIVGQKVAAEASDIAGTAG